MPSTEKRQRRIDTKLPATGGGALLSDSSAEATGPSIPAPGAPTGLRLSTPVLIFSAVTPSAGVTAFWQAPPGLRPDRYSLQWATDAAFIAPSTRAVGGEATSGGLDGLPVARTIYVRVAAVLRGVQGLWSNTASTTTPNDTSPPAPVTGLTVAYIGVGDLEVTWINPASPNFRDAQITVYNDATKTTVWELAYSAIGRWRWTVAENRARTSGSPDATVYVEVQSRSWGGVLSAAVNASATKAQPATPTGATATWDGATGTCIFKWTAVADAASYTLTIDGVGRVLSIAEYAYGLAINRQEHSGVADPVLTWSLIAVDGLGQGSAGAASGTATLARPATPTGLVDRWASDTGIREADWLLTWASQGGIVGYRLTLDSIARNLALATRYSYPYHLNRQEHAGVADPVLTWSLVAIDALDQTSTTPASGTATNAAPPAVAMTVAGYFATVGLFINPPSQAADLRDYRIRVYKDGSATPLITFYTTETLITYEAGGGNGSYTFDAAAVDLFNQVGAASALTAPAVLTDVAAFVSELRESIRYWNSINTPPATLKAALSDGNILTGGYINPASAAWRLLYAERALADRFRTVTLSIASLGAVAWYIATSVDNVNWRYWSSIASGNVLIEVASDAAARASPTSHLTVGNEGNARVDFPVQIEARFFMVGTYNPTIDHQIKEFYPRRLVESDDIRAESIAAVNIGVYAITASKIAAGAITAEKIFATAIDGMTITGALVRTAASGARAELSILGLRTFDATGVLQVEATTATDGTLTGGSGAVQINKDGLTLIPPSGTLSFLLAPVSSVKWQSQLSSGIGGFVQVYESTVSGSKAFNALRIEARGYSDAVGLVGTLRIFAEGNSDSAPQALIDMQGGYAGSPGTPGAIALVGNTSINGTVQLTGLTTALSAVTMNVSLNVPIIGMGIAAVSLTRIRMLMPTDTVDSHGIVINNAANNANRLLVRGDNYFAISGTWVNLSDARVKQDVVTEQPGCLAALLRLRPVAYRYIEDVQRDGPQSRTRHGFIAQEVQALGGRWADMVTAHTEPNGDERLSIAYTELIGPLIAAIQELSEKVDRHKQ